MRKYSAILGNLGNTRDRFCGGYKETLPTLEMLAKAGQIEDIEGIELVGTWDITHENAKHTKKELKDLGLECVSIIPDLFADKIWKNGSLSARKAHVRGRAIEYTRSMCDIAVEMNCKTLNIWPGQDGYDYPLQGDFLDERKYLTESIAGLAQKYPDLRFALEYKAKEPRTHAYLARMADTLLVCAQTGLDNVGVTIDTGHAFLAGENVAESVVLAKMAGNRLFHMHFNDNYRAWDDDMIVGSIHSVEFIELLYWLDECGYTGWFSMDQYPYREDAVGAISESIKWLQAFDSILEKNKVAVRQAIKAGDAVQTSALMRSLFVR